MIVAYLKVPPQHLLGHTYKNDDSRSGYTAMSTNFRTRYLRVQV